MVFILISACSPGQPTLPPEAPPTETLLEKEPEATPTAAATATTSPSLIGLASIFSGESPFCAPEVAESAFTSVCAEGALTVHQKDSRRRVDILMLREITTTHNGPFVLTADILSEPAEGVEMDQNQYGLVVVDGEGMRHALRIRGKYFDWETWSMEGEIKTSQRYNHSYSPFIHPAGQENNFRIQCTEERCDLFINQEFTARLPNEMPLGSYALGVFTASDWDEQFGQVKFMSFQAQPLPSEQTQPQPITIRDDLSSDGGTFSQMGLSGAFNSFEADGFHFSPVIPYGYYAVKANPSFADVSVSAIVHMQIDPQKSSSQYGGLICRSSQEGMYMAVIRADGTYSIFRDTPPQQFALLAERSSEYIRSGAADNELRLECIADQINFYINDHLVESLRDTRYGLQFGRVGLYTKAGGTPDQDAIVFRNFQIEEIQ